MRETAKVNNKSNEETDRQWLTLAQLPRFSLTKLAIILQTNNLQVADLFAIDNEQLQFIGFSDVQAQRLLNPDIYLLDKSTQWLCQPQNILISVDSELYPQPLLQTDKPPILLYGSGDMQLLNTHQLAIVGSRNPSASGKQNAKYFAQGLSQSGWTVTSGLALGIDGLAHEGVLQANGKTIAVLGTGLNNIYPKRHNNMARRILDQSGALVSEFAPDTPARPENFPRRNRIISGMSLGTLIIEAAIKSGSLITAR